MTDLEQTSRRLRAAIDELVADAHLTLRSPAVPGRPVPAPTDAHRRSGRRSLVSIAAAIVVAMLVAAAVYFGPRSTTGSHDTKKPATTHVGAADAPAGWVNLPLFLPSGAFTIDSMIVPTGPVPLSTSGTYAQAYEGSATSDPARLLITTVRAQPGAVSGYAEGSQSVRVDGTIGYLTSFGDHQLVWQTPDGVVVSLESAEMTASDVVAAADLVDPRPASQLGVDLAGALPDGLAPVGEGFSGADDTSQVDTVYFSEGACHAYMQEWAGGPADFEPVAIVATSSRTVTVGGNRILLVDFGTDTMALLWSAQPDVDVRLQGSGCDLTSIAAGLRQVDPSTWRSYLSALGSKAQTFMPAPPTTSPTLPGPGTYGLAH
jgi:hypothetical protein